MIEPEIYLIVVIFSFNILHILQTFIGLIFNVSLLNKSHILLNEYATFK